MSSERASSGWVWFQLAIGWLPIWGLLVALLESAHPEVSLGDAVQIATRMVFAGAVLGPLVLYVVRRVPWPSPVRPSFVALHLGAAVLYGGAWFIVNSIVASILHRMAVVVIGNGLGPFIILGVWLYVMMAGVLYATEATSRAARAELAATQSQLATLRGQLHPHFLFNALHTVGQLARATPAAAGDAAESVAGLLRTSLSETRDLVPLEDDWRFAERYLALEQLRFGERLVVRTAIAPDVMDVLVPSFTVQTLVENAIRHGAAPKVAATTLTLEARIDGASLRLTVGDDGVGADAAALSTLRQDGGLARLRERLRVLFGARGTLDLHGTAHGVIAEVRVPVEAS
ncbi:MAG: histidine kinase [Gemmatimonadaceae bacterium]|nr:histidine kinase [Gemmatimonadaceae bacterium]